MPWTKQGGCCHDQQRQRRVLHHSTDVPRGGVGTGVHHQGPTARDTDSKVPKDQSFRRSAFSAEEWIQLEKTPASTGLKDNQVVQGRKTLDFTRSP